MSNSEKLVSGDLSAKLDTGMSVLEAVERTAAWWNNTGRGLMLQQHNGSQTFARSAFAAPDPDDPSFIPSGILNGWGWDRLTKREKLRMVKYWHHFFVRTQDLIGNDGKVYEFGHRDTIA